MGKELAVNMKRRLKELKRSMTWLACEIGASNGAVWGWCKGISQPNSKYIPKICKALEITQDELFREVSDE